MLAVRCLAQSAVSLKACIPADVAESEQSALISIASRPYRRKDNDCKKIEMCFYVLCVEALKSCY